MDATERLSTGDISKMTEDKAVGPSNGDARQKTKKISRRKSPRRFGRRAKSAERDTDTSTPPSPRLLSDSEESPTTNNSRRNSRKRSLGRLFRRSSPLVRTRSLSASRKKRSKSADRSKADSVIVDDNAMTSYRTFDPHKKPRGRLRKMTVQEARSEQKQRLLDSVNQLPIYKKTYGENSGDSAFFRSRSGTSSSLPDISKHKSADQEHLSPNCEDISLKDSSISKESSSPSSASTKDDRDIVMFKGKRGKNKHKNKSENRSPESKSKTDNKKHSDKTNTCKKTNQKTKKEKCKNENIEPNTNNCDIVKGNDKASKSRSKQKGKDQKKQPSPPKSTVRPDSLKGIGNNDVSERRRQSRATFLSLSNRSPSFENPLENCENVASLKPHSSPIKDRSPPPSYFESQQSTLSELSPTSPTEDYKSPRLFGRSLRFFGRSASATAVPKATTEDSDVNGSPLQSERFKRSRSESAKRIKANRANSEKNDTSSPGSSKTGKYKRTFSPPRKQNEQEVWGDNVRPAATENKPDTICNTETPATALISDPVSKSPVVKETISPAQSSVSSPNTRESGSKPSVRDLATDNQPVPSNKPEHELDKPHNSQSESIECKVVIEVPSEEDLTSKTEDASSDDVFVRKTSKRHFDFLDRDRLSPDPCPSDDEQFFDADDSVGEGGSQTKERSSLSPEPDSQVHRGSLVVDDIPFIEEAPDETGQSTGVVETPNGDQKKGGKLSFKALILVKRLSRRSKTVKRKKKARSPHSSLPDVRIEDYDNETNQQKDDDRDSFVIENESGKPGNIESFNFGIGGGDIIDEKGILKKQLQFEPVASDEPLPREEDPSALVPDLARRRESKYYKLTEKRRKFVSYCKKFAAFLFSHIGLISLVVAYSIMGGFLFMAIEGPHELTHRNNIKLLREATVLEIRKYAMLDKINKLEKSNFTQIVDDELKKFQKQIHVATKERGWDGDDGNSNSLKQWSYASSLLYAITVMTTIGYGHVAPVTGMGRMVTIGYAVLGIPLTLLCLTNMGDLMADGFRLLYGKVCCGLCCLPFRRHTRRLPDPEKGESHVTTDEEEEIDKPKEVIHVPTSLCMLLIVGYILAGASLFSLWEKWDYITGSYFCFITLSTIGFGDIVPGMEIQSWSQQEKLVLCTLYLVIGLSLLAMCFTLVQEDVKAKCRWLGAKIGIIE